MAPRRNRPPDLPGEEWRKVPGWPYEASNRGRVRSDFTIVAQAPSKIGRPVCRLYCLNSMIDAPVAVLVQAAWSGVVFDQSTVVWHRNGDYTDCSPPNLTRDCKSRLWAATKDNVDFPWARSDDEALRRAKSMRQAILTSRHTKAFTKARISHLGIVYPARRSKFTPVAERDQVAVEAVEAVLAAAGIPDDRVALALGRNRTWNWGQGPEVASAINECLTALALAGHPRPSIERAFGWSTANLPRRLDAIGMRDKFTRRPHLGDTEDLPGERWAESGWGYWVSDMGRIVGPRGGLMRTTPKRDGTIFVSLHRKDGERATAPLARLVLAAFKPDLPYSRRGVRFLNGDRSDCRAANMAPARIHAAVGQDFSRFIPRWMEEADRQDVMADVALILAEGRATDGRAAVALAVKNHRKLMARIGDTALDGSRPGDKRTLVDSLSSDGSFVSTGRKASVRND